MTFNNLCCEHARHATPQITFELMHKTVAIVLIALGITQQIHHSHLVLIKLQEVRLVNVRVKPKGLYMSYKTAGF